jgi:hypothetical protein
VARVTDELERRGERLRRQGADPLRLQLLERARRFKRSWIEMAEALCELRSTRAHEAWGFKDLYDYCDKELFIKRATVDKLLVSFGVVQRHAPTLLAPDSEAPMPDYDTVDYFARAEAAHGDRGGPSDEVLAELRQAVFDEARPLGALRRQFNPVIFAKDEEESSRERLERADAAARRLLDLLPDLEVSDTRRVQVETALEALRRDLQKRLTAADAA